jgi:hypothetical protein
VSALRKQFVKGILRMIDKKINFICNSAGLNLQKFTKKEGAQRKQDNPECQL